MKKKNASGISIAERVKSIQYDNGLRVYVISDRSVPTVTVQAWVETGCIHEGKYLGHGLSHFLEHMAFAGTKSYPGAVFNSISELGGAADAYTSFDSTVYHFHLPSNHFRKGLDMLDEMIRFPLFPEERFLLEKDIILRECAMVNDRPGFVNACNILQTMFTRYPLRYPNIGYKEKIAEVNRDMMMDYYRRRYTSERVFFVVAGDVEPQEVFDYLKPLAGSWERGFVDEFELPHEPEQTFPRTHTAYFNDPLYHLNMGWKIPNVSHKDAPALDVLLLILGGSESSRLNQKMKNEQELLSSVNAYSYATKEFGVALISATAKPENAGAVKDGIWKIIDSIHKNGVAGSELKRIISLHKADYIRRMRTSQGLADVVGKSVLACGSPELPDRYLETIENLTVDDIGDVAVRYLTRERMSVAELYPKEMEPNISKVGEKKISSAKLPAMKKLESGIRAIHYGDDSLPLIDIAVVLPAGLIWEKAGQAGISRLLAACLDGGCAKYGEREFNELLEDNAIDLDISAGNNAFIVRMNFTADKLRVATDVFTAMLSKPLFSEKVFQRERSNFMDLLKSGASDPQRLAADIFCKELYGKHPYSSAGMPSPDVIKKITLKDMKQFYHENVLNPKKCCFAISGNISEKDAFQTVERICASIPWNKKASSVLPAPPVFSGKMKQRNVVLAKEQAVVLAGIPSLTVDSKARLSFELLGQASSMTSSEFFKNVREEKGLAYYATTQSMLGLQTGFMVYFAGTRPETAAQVKKLIEAEMKRIAMSGLTAKELKSAKNLSLLRLANQKQNPANPAINSALNEFLDLGYLSAWEDEKRLKNITLAEVNSDLKKIFSSKNRVSVTVSPEKSKEK